MIFSPENFNLLQIICNVEMGHIDNLIREVSQRIFFLLNEDTDNK
jgi:hypothetical protein